MKNLDSFWRGFLILAGILLLGYVLWMLRSILVYLVISAVLALLGRPLVEFFRKPVKGKKWKLPAGLAALLTLGVEVGILAALAGIFLPLITQEITYWQQIDTRSLTSQLQESAGSLQQWFSGQDLMDPEEARKEILKLINVGAVSNTFSTLVGGLGNLFMAAFSILFITFFFLNDIYLPRKILLALVPDRYFGQLGRITPKVRTLLYRYFLGLTIQITLITVLVAGGLSLIGLEQVWVIALFAGLINVIPYLGPIIGAGFGLVLGLAHQLHNVDMLGIWSVKILGVFAAVQLLDNFIFQPLIYSNSVKAHPLEIFLVISIAGTLAGIAGMIIAVPLYSTLRTVAAETFRQFKPVARLTSDGGG